MLANNIERVIQSNAQIKLSDGMDIYGSIVSQTGGAGVEINNEITANAKNVTMLIYFVKMDEHSLTSGSKKHFCSKTKYCIICDKE
uniref:Phage protein n=1 Tax=Steinernema glaseri TaxID=37863 RepID=A0A1I8ALQ8_9BILA